MANAVEFGWPSWSELTPVQQALVSNGAGAEWMPAWLRTKVTDLSNNYLDEASWDHHDYGYMVGGNEFARMKCDLKFLAAMLRDAIKGRSLVGLGIALVFYVLVATLGWAAFYYGNNRPPRWLTKELLT